MQGFSVVLKAVCFLTCVCKFMLDIKLSATAFFTALIFKITDNHIFVCVRQRSRVVNVNTINA